MRALKCVPSSDCDAARALRAGRRGSGARLLQGSWRVKFTCLPRQVRRARARRAPIMTRMDLTPAAPAAQPSAGDEQLLASARRALGVEARAVEALTPRLDGAFAQACRICLECRGRVVVTGMGKSGPHCRQDCRHARQHRHAGLLPAPGGSRPRRPRHDHARGCGAGAVEFRRDARAGAAAAAPGAPRRAADRHDRQARLHARARGERGARRRASPRKPARSISPRPPAPRPRSPWAMRWRWRCWRRAASRARISRARIPAARSGAGCCCTSRT